MKNNTKSTKINIPDEVVPHQTRSLPQNMDTSTSNDLLELRIMKRNIWNNHVNKYASQDYPFQMDTCPLSSIDQLIVDKMLQEIHVTPHPQDLITKKNDPMLIDLFNDCVIIKVTQRKKFFSQTQIQLTSNHSFRITLFPTPLQWWNMTRSFYFF